MKQRGRESGAPAAGRRDPRPERPGELSSGQPSSPGRARNFQVPSWLLGVILAGAVILVYQPVWNGGFIWDDDVYVTENKLLTAPDGLRRIWLSTDSPSQYFPLVYTTFRLEHRLWGLNPAGYHWVNILLHAANGLLVWRLLRRLRSPAAWLGAALFALHPVQVESVAWITERKNVLSLFFSLLTLLTWSEYVERTDGRRRLFYGMALVTFALALFSKTTACTLPVAMLLMLWLRSSPIDGRRIAQVIPFFGLGLGMGLLTVWWERFHVGTSGGIFSIGPVERLLVAGRAIWFYLGKLVWPASLTFSYPRWDIHAGNPLPYLWLGALIALGLLVLSSRKRFGRAPETAALFYVATLSPLLGIVMLYTFRYTFVADHYQYVASIGPLALGAAGLALVERRLRWEGTAWGTLLGSALVLTLALLTWRQARVYRDIESVWRDTISKNPGSWLGHSGLGRRLMQQGRFAEALVQYQEALRIDPRDVDSMVFAGNALLKQGHDNEAIAYYSQALQINPDNPEAHVNMAVVLANQGQTEAAVEHDRKALQMNPGLLGARMNLAVGLVRLGKVEEALDEYNQILKLNPDQPLAHINLAIALTTLGRTNEAQAQYAEAAAAVNKHVDVLLQQGRNNEAAAQLTESIRRIPNNASAHCRLAALLAAQGRKEEARAHFTEALRLQPDSKEAQEGLRALQKP